MNLTISNASSTTVLPIPSIALRPKPTKLPRVFKLAMGQIQKEIALGELDVPTLTISEQRELSTEQKTYSDEAIAQAIAHALGPERERTAMQYSVDEETDRQCIRFDTWSASAPENRPPDITVRLDVNENNKAIKCEIFPRDNETNFRFSGRFLHLSAIEELPVETQNGIFEHVVRHGPAALAMLGATSRTMQGATAYMLRIENLLHRIAQIKANEDRFEEFNAIVAKTIQCGNGQWPLAQVDRARIFAKLAVSVSHLPLGQRNDAFHTLLDEAQKLDNQADKAMVFAALAQKIPYFRDPLDKIRVFNDLLGKAKKLQGEHGKAIAFAAIATSIVSFADDMPQFISQFGTVLGEATELKNEASKAMVLAALAKLIAFSRPPFDQISAFNDLLDQAKELQNDADKAMVFAALTFSIQCFDEDASQFKSHYEALLGEAKALKNETDKATVFATLAQRISFFRDPLEQILVFNGWLGEVKNLQNEDGKAMALTALANDIGLLNGDTKSIAFDYLQKEAEELASDANKTTVFDALADKLDELHEDKQFLAFQDLLEKTCSLLKGANKARLFATLINKFDALHEDGQFLAFQDLLEKTCSSLEGTNKATSLIALGSVVRKWQNENDRYAALKTMLRAALMKENPLVSADKREVLLVLKDAIWNFNSNLQEDALTIYLAATDSLDGADKIRVFIALARSIEPLSPAVKQEKACHDLMKAAKLLDEDKERPVLAILKSYSEAARQRLQTLDGRGTLM